MMDLSTPQIFKPPQNPRKPEILAWVLASISSMVKILFPTSGFFNLAGTIFVLSFLISAVIISIGNWTNRSSELTISEDKIRFFNGLKETSFYWEDITRVEVYKGQFNDKISVVSTLGRLNFDIHRIAIEAGKTSPSHGFEDGELILKTILEKTNLNGRQRQETQGYYYYSIE